MTVADLIAVLGTYDPTAEVRLSVRGHHVAQPAVGLGCDATKEVSVIIADRETFAGKLPDGVLTRASR